MKNSAHDRTLRSMAEVRELNKESGGHWFSRETVFCRRLGCRTYPGLHGRTYFTSSETNPSGVTAYTVRVQHGDGRISTVGSFHSHKTSAQARDMAALVSSEDCQRQPVTGHRERIFALVCAGHDGRLEYANPNTVHYSAKLDMVFIPGSVERVNKEATESAEVLERMGYEKEEIARALETFEVEAGDQCEAE